MKYSSLLVLIACCLCPVANAEDTDVVVYGATPGGICAAVAAADHGVNVVLVDKSHVVGGLVASGLSYPDIRVIGSRGGLYREFMSRVESHYASKYGVDSQEYRDCYRGVFYEPHVAERVFREMLVERGVRVITNFGLDSAELSDDGRRIVAAAFHPTESRSGYPTPVGSTSQTSLEAKLFIDGTYEGDLMAAAGVKYFVGCEGFDVYGESASLGFPESNNWVQTYSFRVCVTNDPSNRIPFPKPQDYVREDFEPLAEAIAEGRVGSVFYPGPKPLLKLRRFGRNKADMNDIWDAAMSLSLENVNHPWPDGSNEVRAEIFDLYKRHTLGLLYFLRTDLSVPEAWRNEVSEWGLCRDEFVQTDHFPPELYVREARRMIGKTVFTEHDLRPLPGSARTRLHTDSVAIGEQSMNCHGVYSPEPGVTLGHGFEKNGPFQIPYGVLVPNEVDNLLVPVACSSSHIGFCALRTDPIWASLGEAAGVAASVVVEKQLSVGDVPVNVVQDRLHQAMAQTIYVSDLGEKVIQPPASFMPQQSATIRLQQVDPTEPEKATFLMLQRLGTRGFLHPLSEGMEPHRRRKIYGNLFEGFEGHAARLSDPAGATLLTRWPELGRESGSHEVDTTGSEERTIGDVLRDIDRVIK